MLHSKLLVKQTIPQPWVQAGSGRWAPALAPDIPSELLAKGQCITEHPQETPAPHAKGFFGHSPQHVFLTKSFQVYLSCLSL